METVTSSDGTRIAFDRLGDGPPIVLVCGQSTDRSSNAPLAALLAEHFAVFNYDRRGRGDSGDTQPYALERELEDLDALIAEAGGSAHLYGVSSGGALEVAGAVGLLVPRLSGLAALGLAALMVGATVTNLFIIGERPWLPVGLLLVSAVIAWGRRSRTRILRPSRRRQWTV